MSKALAEAKITSEERQKVVGEKEEALANAMKVAFQVASA